MKKIDLGRAIGIVANIGVIAGIVFLAIEVRNASNANQLQAAYAGVSGFNEVNLQMAADPGLSRICFRRNGRSRSADQRRSSTIRKLYMSNSESRDCDLDTLHGGPGR